MENTIEFLRLELELFGYSLVKGVLKSESESLISKIGTLLPQYDGEVTNVIQSKVVNDGLPLSRSNGEIGPHTDGISIKEKLNFLGLYCIRSAKCGGGQTNLYDGLRIFRELDKEDLQLCMTKKINFRTYGELDQEKSHCAGKNILELSTDGKININYSYNYFVWGDINPVNLKKNNKILSDKNMSVIVNKINDICKKIQVSIQIPDNGLLIIDNRRMLHSRNAFSDEHRRLIRYWVR